MTELRYSRQQITDADVEAVVRALRSDHIAGDGPEVEAFEAELAEYVGAKHAVAVSSGTAALHLAYLAIGIPAVLTSPLSFVATANAALLAGAGVWFADVDRATGNIATWECGLPKYVFAPVHYAGRAAHIPERQHTDMVVVEDACHALGATDFDGCSRVGSCAHSLATVFSTHAVKPITTGEGGAVTTNDQGFADEVRMLRSHGRRDGEMVALGMNARMTDIQAALGRSQLQRCDEMRERRMVLAESYYDALDRMDEEGAIALPDPLHHWEWNAWHLYPIRIKNGKRDAVKSALNAQGIGAQVHYPSIHLQRYYRERFGYKPGDFPEAEAWAAEELSLPLHAGMTERDVTRVVDALRKELSA